MSAWWKRLVRGWENLGYAETRDSATPRGAGISAEPAAGTPHSMTRGNRNAIPAPSNNNPALTSNVTCSPCTKESRAA